jgi:hypothetical protein
LTYALAAPFVWVAGLTEFDVLPTLAFRLVNAASMAVGVVLAGLLAAELFPGRRLIGFSAAVLTAVVPNLVAVGGYAHNDGAALALTTGCLLVSAHVLRRGLSPARLAAAAAVASGAVLARASSAVAVAAVVASIVVAVWRAVKGGAAWSPVPRAARWWSAPRSPSRPAGSTGGTSSSTGRRRPTSTCSMASAGRGGGPSSTC